MFEQAFFSAILIFTVYSFGKFLLKYYEEHIKRLDESNESLSKMADHLEEVVSEKRKRAEDLAKRKIEADKRRAYQQGKKEAMESGKVTPIRQPQRPAYHYKQAKDGEFFERPAEYNREQGLG